MENVEPYNQHDYPHNNNKMLKVLRNGSTWWAIAIENDNQLRQVVVHFSFFLVGSKINLSPHANPHNNVIRFVGTNDRT